MFVPTTLPAHGRGHLTAHAQPDERGVTIRLDDDRRLDWWAEVRLPVSALTALLGQVSQCQLAVALDECGHCEDRPELCGRCDACGR
jgi:hypothetical protein